MSKVKIVALTLAVLGISSLGASWVLASMGPETARSYPDNVLSRIEDAGFPRRKVDETHTLDLAKTQEIVLQTVSIDVDVQTLPAGAPATVSLRSSVSEGVESALEMNQQGDRLVLATDEHEENRDGWRFTWRSDEPGHERGLILRLPADWKGRLVFESVSGDFEAQGLNIERLDTKTVSGEVQFSGSARDLKFVTVSGDAMIKTAANTGLSIDASSVSGDLEAPGLTQQESPGQTSLEGSIGDGATRLRFESVSGDLEIKN